MLGLLLFRRIAREVGAAAHRITRSTADQPTYANPGAEAASFLPRGAPPRPVLRERAGVRGRHRSANSTFEVRPWAFAFSRMLKCERRMPNVERRTPNVEWKGP